MPGTTPRGYPYPLPTEPVAEGAAAIRALADALDAKVAGDLIQTITLAAAGPIVFSGIPAIYNELVLSLYVRGASNIAGGLDSLLMRFNDQTAGAYNSQFLYAYQNTVAAGFADAAAGAFIANIPDGSNANLWAALVCRIPGYRVPGYKTWTSDGDAAAPGGGGRIFKHGGIYWGGGADVISKIGLYQFTGSNLAVGSRASLYGRR